MNTFCGYFDAKTCRSCGLIELPYPEQIQRKESKLRTGLANLSFDLLPTTTSAQQKFRNKAKLSVTGTLGTPIIGLWGEADLDKGREILDCPLHHPEINRILGSLAEFIQLALLTPYHIATQRGELKGVIIYHSERSGESYLRFIMRSKESLDRIKKHLTFWQSKFSKLTSISANIQPVPHALLEGEEEIYFTELRSITHRLQDHSIRLGPQGFVQTNQQVAEKLYQTAANWTQELNINKFAELFSGQGAFSFFVSSKVKLARGFEINPDAVKMASESARILKLNHLEFICKDAAQIEEELLNFGADLVLVNPPRRGLGESLEHFKKCTYPHLIYSSCSIESLANDLTALSHAYEIKKIQIFDMFPNTEHFETLVLLSKIS